MLYDNLLDGSDKDAVLAEIWSVNQSAGNDGSLTRSFTAMGKTHTYRYERGEDGLVFAPSEKGNLL